MGVSSVRNKFYLFCLGCPKNEVDAEGMSTLLHQAGWRQASRAQAADVLIVNTCGFIQAARDESYAALRELADAKRPGQLLVAAGCLAQRDGEQLLQRVPQIDGVLIDETFTKKGVIDFLSVGYRYVMQIGFVF